MILCYMIANESSTLFFSSQQYTAKACIKYEGKVGPQHKFLLSVSDNFEKWHKVLINMLFQSNTDFVSNLERWPTKQ